MGQLIFKRTIFNMKSILQILLVAIVIQCVFGFPQPDERKKGCEDKNTTLCQEDPNSIEEKCEDEDFEKVCKKTCNACKPPKPCKDKKKNCSKKICEGNNKKLKNKCKKTCGKCEPQPCQDKKKDCTQEICDGDNKKLKNKCKKFCGNCGPKPKCKDKDKKFCEGKLNDPNAKPNLCEKPKFLKKCKETCNKCPEESQIVKYLRDDDEDDDDNDEENDDNDSDEDDIEENDEDDDNDEDNDSDEDDNESDEDDSNEDDGNEDDESEDDEDDEE